MSLVGKKIGEFETEAYADFEFKKVSDKDFLGKWNVLVFYPADFSFVCPTELEDLEEQYEALKSLGVQVYSCSTDTQFVHAAWHQESPAIGKITYTMLADPNWKLARLFDVLDEEEGLAQRGSFIIDPDGIIQAVEITADGIGRDASQLVDKVKAAQFIREHPDQVCPAKWKKGEAALTAGIDLVGKI